MYFLQGINDRAMAIRTTLGESFDSIYGAIYNPSKFASVFCGSSLSQTESRLSSCKPGWVSVDLLRSSKPQYLTEVSINGDLTSLRRATLAENVIE